MRAPESRWSYVLEVVYLVTRTVGVYPALTTPRSGLGSLVLQERARELVQNRPSNGLSQPKPLSRFKSKTDLISFIKLNTIGQSGIGRLNQCAVTLLYYYNYNIVGGGGNSEVIGCAGGLLVGGGGGNDTAVADKETSPVCRDSVNKTRNSAPSPAVKCVP